MEKTFRKPDVKAPRFRPKTKNILSRDFFKKFRDKYPEYISYSDEDLGKIVCTMHEAMWKVVTQERDGIEIPEGIGFVFMGTCQPTKLYNTDYGKSIKHNMRIKAQNWESDNHLMKIFYSNFSTKYKFKNRNMWYFKGVRDFTRSASAAYKQDWRKFVRVEDQLNIHRMFITSRKRDKAIAFEKASMPADYNEFLFDN